jgi:FkbM family methyltransferase
VSFEPNPSAHKRLAKNVALNEDVLSTTISLLQLGVADTDSTFELRLDRDNLGSSSLVAESGEVVQVHCKPLLEVLESLGIERVNGLKIDIEGAEDVALAPFLTQAPRSMLPDIIVIENSEHLWKTDLFALIRSSGYSLKLKTRMNSVYQLM